MTTRKTIDGVAAVLGNVQFRRWRNQPVQKEPRTATIPRTEALLKMENSLSLIHQAEKRIISLEETKATWQRLGLFSGSPMRRLENDIEITKAAKKRLKRYFNRVARNIELF